MPASFGTLHLNRKLLLTARLGEFFDNVQILSDSILNIGNRFCLGRSLRVTSWEPWNGYSKSFVRFVDDYRVFHSTSPKIPPIDKAITIRQYI